MKATFIDCYRQDNKIILWVRCNGENLRLEDSFVPVIYARTGYLQQLRKKLYSKGVNSSFVKKNNFLGKEVWALAIDVNNLCMYGRIRRYIERLYNYNIEIYNADLHLEEYYMFNNGLFPLAKVNIQSKGDIVSSIKNIDDASDIDYKIPSFMAGKLGVKTKENLFKNDNTELLAVRFNSEVFKGEEKDILLRLKESFQNEDPDILWAENGNIILPYLKQKLQKYDIGLNFNRFDEDDIRKKEGDYFRSYSKVVYRTSSVFLKGRLHFDTRTFFADDTGYYGILDGARICRQRIQRTEMRSAGASVTNLLMYYSYKKNFLLPYKIGIYERFKTLEELYIGDRGSIIYEPRVGFHTDVAEFDFVSLYPNIMNKFNLSPETLFCKCCRYNKVPGLNYHYCKKKRGIVSDVAKELIQRRIELKKKNTPEAKQKVDFIKWLLVTMFGYQAFKNRKIGIIESHESIQSYAREILIKATRIAELNDWEVIHGIIDSIYVKKMGFNDSEIERLGREIFIQTGMELNHEGNYRWIVFLPSLLDKRIPVANRFYGVFKDGEIKIRGIEARRKDTPKIIADMQLEIIEKLAKAENFEEFKSLFPNVFQILKNYIKSLSSVNGEDLAIFKSLSKVDYKNDIAQRIIVQKMVEQGYQVNPGQTIAYIIQDFHNTYPRRRYALLDGYRGRFDHEKYKGLLIRAVFSLLQPFDVTVESLYEYVGERQMKIGSYEKKPMEKEVKLA